MERPSGYEPLNVGSTPTGSVYVICLCSVMANTAAFQAANTGSIPVTDSMLDSYNGYYATLIRWSR